MKIKLLDYTGAGHLGKGAAARYAAELLVYAKSTRLTQGEELQDKIRMMSDDEISAQLDAIVMTVRSSWEFVSYTWQIEGVTRAFTHQMVRSRHASFAQQAMRVADMSDFEHAVPDSVKAAGQEKMWNLCMMTIADTYRQLRAADIPAQDARGVLPTNVLTNIVAQYNLRAFSELLGKRLNPRAQGEYEEVISRMKECVLAVHPWAEKFFHPERTKAPALQDVLKKQLDGRSPVDVPEVNQALKELDLLRGVWG